MTFRPRVPVEFQAITGAFHFFFPLDAYEWSSDQPVEAPEVMLTGESYGYDQLGRGPAPVRSAIERIRFVIAEPNPAWSDELLDNLIGDTRNAGRGWLIAEDAQGQRRRARARVLGMPSIRVSATDSSLIFVSVAFRRSSDWEDMP